MSDNNYGTPWKLDEFFVLDNGGENVGLVSEMGGPIFSRRIVACVNACRNQSDENLADDCVEKLLADRNMLLAQRDELLAALKALYGWTKAEGEHFDANTPDDFIVEMVEKALHV